MGEYNFKVNITPDNVLTYIKAQMDCDLIYERTHKLENDKCIIILVYEKYYFRASNRASLTVTINNFNGVTEVNSISAGSSQGVIFNFDWGAGDNFAASVKNILKNYIGDDI